MGAMTRNPSTLWPNFALFAVNQGVYGLFGAFLCYNMPETYV